MLYSLPGGFMLEPIHIPILLKAIDFVFDEGRKILEERRERRKASAAATKPEPVEIQETNQTKQDLLTSKVDEILWKDHELEVQHLVRLLETYSRNYHL